MAPTPVADCLGSYDHSASYFFADATQAYISYEDIDGGDFDDLDVGINHYYSDSCKATLEIDFEEDGVVDDDMTIQVRSSSPSDPYGPESEPLNFRTGRLRAARSSFCLPS